MRRLTFEVGDKAGSPDFLAGFRLQADEHAVAGHRVEPVAVHGRRTARTVSFVIAERVAGGRLPDLFTGRDVERDDELLLAGLPLGVQAFADDRE